MIAQPLTTLARRPGKRAPVGLPLTPEGEEGEAATRARGLGEAIAARSGVPVHFLDERMTTAHALKSARRAGVRDADSRARIDQMAAVGILQAWLDRRKGGRAEEPES